ncbi:MAG: stage II sporulation protein M [Anaerolineaceae bacterium]|nr:stage II sporulation protein M [Anaerolineaceae bacterium]
MAATTPLMLEQTAQGSEPTGFRYTLGNALIITRREVRDSFRDWRIIAPIVILTFLFPGLAQFVAGRFAEFVAGYGADIIGERTIPFLLMIVGFFPISISLVIALETFVGEKERRSLEPLLSTPLTNTELYIGKTLAAMIPPLLSSYGGMGVYLTSLVLGDLEWRPPAMLVVQIILLTTVQALVMVTGAVVVSSQTTSTRAANLLASFIIIPMTMLIQGESVIMFLAPDAEDPNGIGALWAIIIGMAVVVFLLLRVGNSIFNREELLGRTIDQLNLKGTARKIWRFVLAVDDDGTPARNIVDWYRRGIRLSLGRLRSAVIVTIVVCIVALVAGYIIGQMPEWRLPLPEASNLTDTAQTLGRYTSIPLYTGGFRFFLWQNSRVLLAAALISMFTFGVGALVITPVVYLILGYLFSQIVLAGYNPSFLFAAVLTHGVVEIPIIILATAVALRLGAVITRPPEGITVGHAWLTAFGDTVKLAVGVILPGLVLAALIEAYITPRVVLAVLGG